MLRFPPRKILVPIDFTEPSLAAWGYARELSGRTGASLEALHVAPVTLSREKRALRLRELKSFAAGADAALLAAGDILFGILRASERRRADLLVMGTSAPTGLARLRHDSMVEEVVRSSKVPVLSLHGPALAPSRILAPVKLSPYSLKALEFARRVGDILDAKVSVLHVREEKGEARAVPRGVRVVSGRPVARIVEEGDKHDLIVMAVHRNGLFHDAVLGSTAERVLRLSRTPVLSVPPEPAPAGPKRPAARRGARSRRRQVWIL
jgi:nucleotide-binding universal stress UspA family protein